MPTYLHIFVAVVYFSQSLQHVMHTFISVLKAKIGKVKVTKITINSSARRQLCLFIYLVWLSRAYCCYKVVAINDLMHAQSFILL